MIYNGGRRAYRGPFFGPRCASLAVRPIGEHALQKVQGPKGHAMERLQAHIIARRVTLAF